MKTSTIRIIQINLTIIPQYVWISNHHIICFRYIVIFVIFLDEIEKMSYSNKYTITLVREIIFRENFENEEKIRNYKEQPSRFKRKPDRTSRNKSFKADIENSVTELNSR